MCKKNNKKNKKNKKVRKKPSPTQLTKWAGEGLECPRPACPLIVGMALSMPQPGLTLNTPIDDGPEERR